MAQGSSQKILDGGRRLTENNFRVEGVKIASSPNFTVRHLTLSAWIPLYGRSPLDLTSKIGEVVVCTKIMERGVTDSEN